MIETEDTPVYGKKNKKKKTKCGVYLVALELLYVGPS
jgi:hypothetical protein